MLTFYNDSLDFRLALTVMRAGGVEIEDILAPTVTLHQTERGPRSEADHELFLERTSRASLMLKYEGKHQFFDAIKPHTLNHLNMKLPS